MTTTAPAYRPCFSGYTEPRSGKQYRCMRTNGHGGTHTCAGVSWSDTEADWLTTPVVELPAEIRCASLHVGCCSKALYACTRESGHTGNHVSGIVTWTIDKAVQ